MPHEDSEKENPLTLHDVSNVDELRKLLHNGANINETNIFEETPLHCSLRRGGDLQLIEEFLKHDADVNAKDCWGVTPLYCAVARHGNNLRLIKLLLDHGADIRSGNRINDRFLDHTVTHKRSCAKLLIKYKFLKNNALVKNLKSQKDSKTTRDYYQEYKNIVDLDLKSSCYVYLGEYLDNCSSEILQMQSVCLRGNSSLLDFISTNHLCTFEVFVENNSKQQALEKVFEDLALNEYRIFKDVILSKIGRRNLLEKIHEQWATKEIKLNVHSMEYVSHYLTDGDLLNFVIAFLNST